MKRALKVLTDREVSPQLGLLKSTLLQLDSTFSERDYGVSTFRDFIEKVAKTGLVTLRHSGRSMMVDAVEAADGAEPPPVGDFGDRIRRHRTGGICGFSRRAAAGALPAPGRPLDRRTGPAIVESVTRRVRPRHAAAAMADVRASAEAVHPRGRSGLSTSTSGGSARSWSSSACVSAKGFSGWSAIAVGRSACSQALRLQATASGLARARVDGRAGGRLTECRGG